MIQLDAVTKIYAPKQEHSVTAVRATTLTIERGEFAIVVGRSGSGKTTLLNLMAGLTQPSSGSVKLYGTDLWSLSDERQSHLRNQTIGFIFQFPSLLPFLTVYENLILPTRFGRSRAANPPAVNVPALADRYLEKVGLTDKRDVYPRQLSAGQQQRAVIARALMNQPPLLLADEPTSNLDEKTELEIMNLFAEIHVSLGVTIVMVTHTRQLLSFGTRAVEMANGEILNPQERGEA
jgi:ABC-type lipoprotein export system ATPase subunit